MTRLSVSTYVAAPPPEVFAVYTNLGKAPERIPGIVSVELLTDGPFGVGTRWRETRLMFKKEATEEMWVTACDPPRSYTVVAESHGMRYTTVFSFVPEGDGTKVTWDFQGTPLTLGTKIFSPIFSVMMKGMMQKHMRGDLEALRAVCEAGR
jgi:carbon monoxide dehydrogenase subunit G